MSEKVDVAAAALREKIGGSGFQGTVRFDITGDGSIHVADETVTTGDDGGVDDVDGADCTITASMETLREMFEGGLDPAAAFMTGKIRIAGNMAMALKLAQSL